jgi:hypothetical protein
LVRRRNNVPIAVAQLEGSDQIVDSRVTCVVSENLLGERGKNKKTIKEQSGISREQIRLRGPFDSLKEKQGVSVNALVSEHKRSLSVAKEAVNFEKDVMYKAAMSFEKQMEEIVHTFFKLEDGLQVNKPEDIRTKYSQAKEVLANYDNVYT